MPSTESLKRNSDTSSGAPGECPARKDDGDPSSPLRGLDAASAGADASARPGAAVRVVLALLRGYKVLISPLFAGSCRFTPSCSEYMAEAVRRHGVLRGAWLGAGRLARCRPFGGHGFDPVP